jgi:protein-L-isoaspartate(D-aspartate) O-methyltransferase
MGAVPMSDPANDTMVRERTAMVEQQLRRRGIIDERVLAAMSSVPRERFVTDPARRRAYEDVALPIDEGQSISQPYMVARMTELLAVRPGDRILEIGTGSGYQAAILATLETQVVTIERHAGLAAAARARLVALGFAAAVDVRVGDGSVGVPGDLFDGIVVTAGAPEIPRSLPVQLVDGGRLVIPVGPRELQQLVVVTRRGDTWEDHVAGECVFVPLVGEGGWAR